MYTVRVINTDGPGDELAEFSKEEDAQQYAESVAMDYHYGVCIENSDGDFDCEGNGEYDEKDDCWT